MKNVWRFAFCSLTTAVFVVATAWAVPPRPANTPARLTNAQTPQPVQSVSGKITSVDRSSFTLAIATTGTGQQFQDGATSPKTMSFTIDQNTTIDGRLKVGSTADVTYRQADGNNVAVSVHVAP
jgi:Cu/Ag efflux protein CusF